jgi:hypothetical protein
MPALVTVTATDLQHLVASFDVAMDPSTLNGGMNWTLVPSVAGTMPAVVTNATLRSNGQVVDLIIGAAMTAAKQYVLTAPNAKTALGVNLVPPNNTLAFTTPAVSGDTSEFPGRILQAVTRATGEEIQVISGRAMTRLVAPFGENDAVAFVETTLGFPPKGRFVAGNRKYTYTGRTDCSFTGCVKLREWDGTAVSEWTTVLYDPYSWFPEE